MTNDDKRWLDEQRRNAEPPNMAPFDASIICLVFGVLLLGAVVVAHCAK